MRDFDIRSIPTPEFDYNYLMGQLSQYRQPWSKIRQLLRQGLMTRVKKGIYVKNLGDGLPYSECILANMIYGPSYVSCEYALAWYGMIPEGVVQVTSVTLKPSKTFTTPIGIFDYKHLTRSHYAYGFVRISLDDQRAFLIASREKALVDTIISQEISQCEALREYLTSDLRIELDELRRLDLNDLNKLALRFQKNIVVQTLVTLVQELQEMKS